MYVHGLGVPVDYDKALELLEPGMSNREAAAYTLKAYMYAGYGKGCGGGRPLRRPTFALFWVGCAWGWEV
jgi:TPR repeat protein